MARQNLLRSAQGYQAMSSSSMKQQPLFAAIESMGSLDPPAVLPVLRKVSSSNDPLIRNTALRTIAGLDLAAAAALADQLLRRDPTDTAVQGIVSPFLGRKGGPSALAKALSKQEVDPRLAAQIHAVLGAAGRQRLLERICRVFVLCVHGRGKPFLHVCFKGISLARGRDSWRAGDVHSCT